jgi:hypothetical protein
MIMENILTAKEKAQCGLWLLEEAIVELLEESNDWMKHSVIQDKLCLRHDFNGNHAGYLSGAILNRLESQKRIIREGTGRGVSSKFRLPNSN